MARVRVERVREIGPATEGDVFLARGADLDVLEGEAAGLVGDGAFGQMWNDFFLAERRRGD